MKRKFLRTFVLLVTAFAAVTFVVCSDSLQEFGVEFSQGQMQKASAETLTTRTDRQIANPLQVAASGHPVRLPDAAAKTKSYPLVCLATCVLLC